MDNAPIKTSESNSNSQLKGFFLIFSFRIYTCVGNKWRETEFVDRDWWCRAAQVTKACIQESYETCMGFFQDQVKIFIEDYYGQGGGYYGRGLPVIPECLTPYL